MKVLISIQQPVTQWQIPVEGVAALRVRFPHIEFVHATSDEQRAAGLRDCDAAYTWILRAPEFATAARLKWMNHKAENANTNI